MHDSLSSEQAKEGATDCLLGKREVAARLRISRRTLDQWMRNGRVPYFKIQKSVRFRWPDVLAKLQALRIN
jgi:excisionase family DNA binding protein